MGFVKYMNFTHLSEADKKALKKKLETQKKELQAALKSLSAKGKKKKAKKKSKKQVGLK